MFRAVLASGRSDEQKLLYALNMELRDEYDICQGADVVDRDWPTAVWSAAADALARRLEDLPAGSWKDEFSAKYQRDRLSNRLIQSLRRAGREAEVLPLCEEEARITGSYERLVNELTTAGRTEDVKRWALEGLERVGEKWPGIAKHLQDRLRDLAEREKDWPAVAAIRADEFFDRPNVASLTALQQAADRAGRGPEVRAAALHFLETGERPQAGRGAGKRRRPGRCRSRSAESRRPRSRDGPPGTGRISTC